MNADELVNFIGEQLKDAIKLIPEDEKKHGFRREKADTAWTIVNACINAIDGYTKSQEVRQAAKAAKAQEVMQRLGIE